MSNPLLKLAEDRLGWPEPEAVFSPPAAAKKVLAEAADRKIGNSIRRFPEAVGARVGILSPNATAETTEAPLAVVCEFPRPVSNEVLIETQRLAWNFSLAPLLITVEPHLLRSFTCWEHRRDEENPSAYRVVPDIDEDRFSLSEHAARALHWVSLSTGELFRTYEPQFRQTARADCLLRENLREVRKKLLSPPNSLNQDVCHDLLARVIFIQFLMDRRDSRGDVALDPTTLAELSGCRNFWEVLRDRDRTYSLFQYLNAKFNGDLFAGNDGNDCDSEPSLSRERAQITQSHLNLLADMVEGKLQMENGQQCLWRQYAFDVIPLEFISSIYEEFVSKRRKEGIYFTPQHLVDFVLDGVLPWNSRAWDVKIMDPACGSGVFLVKALQRLVRRWGLAHNREKPSVEVLRSLLEQNIYGVDSNAEAVRVAAFSLYLAMCEHIEPARLWQSTTFPKLRGKRLVCSDFFGEEHAGFRTEADASKYDLVVGNPPWGKGTISESSAAAEWAEKNGWAVAYKDIGPIFLPKCAALTRSGGVVSMLQPAKALLFNRTADRFREQFFQRFKVEEITNLAAVRFDHFQDSNSPVCIVSLRPDPPDGEPLTYICPKPTHAGWDENLIIVEPQDVNSIAPDEAWKDRRIWTALMWGGRRDLALVRKLSDSSKYSRLSESKSAVVSTGIIRGTRGVEHQGIVDLPILRHYREIQDCFLHIDPDILQPNEDAVAERGRNPAAFRPPQLILKRSWLARENRFRAFLVIPDKAQKGILVPDNYVSVHEAKEYLFELEATCLTYNSILALYYLLLTSSRFAGERPTVLVDEALSVPLPKPGRSLMEGVSTFEEVDQRILEAFDFSDVEWALIKDMSEFTIPYFKGKDPSPGSPTTREKDGGSELEFYADYFVKVLRAGFGIGKSITCVAFVEEERQQFLPVRLMAVYLDSPLEDHFTAEKISNAGLYALLAELHRRVLHIDVPAGGGVVFQRVARIYDVTPLDGRKVPTIYLIKPDQVRYWTRSMALRDADEVAADIMSWAHDGTFTTQNHGATA